MYKHKSQGLVERGCLSQVIMVMLGIIVSAILLR
jgi:hypothetical protein